VVVGRDRVTVGIVGVGQVATDAHLPVLLGLGDVRVAWVVDANDRKAELVARAIGVRPIRLPRDVRHLPDADVVLLAIPYGARVPYYEEFGKRGTAVYAEKPFAVSRADHDRIEKIFPAHHLGCGFQRRSSAAVRRLREVVSVELFGKLLTARVEFGGPGTRGGSYYWDLGLAGGGVLLEVGVHALDAVLFVSEATEVRTTNVRMVREHGFDVHTEATVEVAVDPVRTFELEVLVSSLQFTAMTNLWRFEHATVAHAVVQEGDALWVTPVGRTGQHFRLNGNGPDYPRTNAQQLNEHWTQFLEAVRSGQPNYTNASAVALTSSLVGQLYMG
jgi:predicted dehydrogenase